MMKMIHPRTDFEKIMRDYIFEQIGSIDDDNDYLLYCYLKAIYGKISKQGNCQKDKRAPCSLCKFDWALCKEMYEIIEYFEEYYFEQEEETEEQKEEQNAKS